ncbi:MAG: DNA-directed RNA polymerase subunit beta, partial [Pseudomonadota bacterium]
MAQSFVEKKRIRKSFGRIGDAAAMPNLIQVQKDSYEQFLQRLIPHAERKQEGIEAVFKSVFPITDFTETAVLEYVSYEFEPPKYDTEECQQRDMTYAAPLKVTLRLIVFEVDEDTGAKSVKDIKEQEVYMGDMPLMTDNGTFIVNGTERVIVSQMHRSPGVFFDHDKGKSHSSGKLLFGARIIPYRGSWLDFEFDPKDIVNVRIDRRRKLPATTLLYALGMDQEEILDEFYSRVGHKRVEGGFAVPFNPERYKGVKLERDLINADTGDVVAELGKKLSARAAKKLAEDGLKNLLFTDEQMIGRYFASDLVNFDTGEIYAEAGQEIEEKTLELLSDIGIDEFDTLDVDHVSIGGYVRNTLAADKNSNRDMALIDIYRVMRPGEPPTLETAEGLFYSLFFDPERYDLSAVGRVKMNIRLNFEDVSDEIRTLRKEDILSVLG